MRFRSGDPQRFWLSDDDIERRAEAELQRAGLMPSETHPIVDVERFVERHLGATLDTYADLDDDVLGQTEFVRGTPPHVRVNRALTAKAFDDPDTPPGAEERWRATVAHEAAHVLFHAHLFAGPQNLDLFDMEAAAPVLHRCGVKDVMFRAGASDWKEIQANRGMAALLMPRSFFVRRVRAAFVTGFGSEQPSRAQAESLTATLAATFNVSKQALSIRVTALQLVGDGKQQKL